LVKSCIMIWYCFCLFWLFLGIRWYSYNVDAIASKGGCGERSLACTSDEIRRELKKGFLGYQCTSQDGLSSTNRSTDLTKGETRSVIPKTLKWFGRLKYSLFKLVCTIIFKTNLFKRNISFLNWFHLVNNILSHLLRIMLRQICK